jgi:predicted metal-dependent enzyme (double-stranded beta helix superfamily)
MQVDELTVECVGALSESEPRVAVRAVLERAVTDRTLVESLGSPTPGLNVLHHAADLTVLNVVWPPLVSLFPHDHRMWAAIGIYGGREDNSFYRRQGRTVIASGGKELAEGDVLLLGDDVIHGVDNPMRVYTGAIHVYGGDFFATPRSQWDADTLEEAPWDIEAVREAFAAAERAVAADGGPGSS